MTEENLTPTPDEIMNISPLTPDQVQEEILKTLQSIADTLNTVAWKIEEIRHSVVTKG